jgi:tRNA U34 5-methylaminomethyl-2-thiouridine-forming methyltransferase MnmC
MNPELITTSDGSHSLYVAELNENYHSTHGALQESLHVFITHGLDYRPDLSSVRILEVGLGTGLNALLTVRAAVDAGKAIDYVAVEAFPLPDAITSRLNYPALLGDPRASEWFESIHSAPWHQQTDIAGNFKLTKLQSKLQDVTLQGNFFDVVYFDAFAPQKQPEMWTTDVFKKVYDAVNEGGCLVTYCAKGQVKRDLRSVGFQVESLPGPKGKREMIRAIRRKS